MVQKNNWFAAVLFDLASIVFLYNTSWKSIETVRSLSGSLVFFVNVELEPEKILEFLRILLFHMQTWNQGDDTCVFVLYVWHNTGALCNVDNKACCDSSEGDEDVYTAFDMQCHFLTMSILFLQKFYLSAMSVNVPDDHLPCKK